MSLPIMVQQYLDSEVDSFICNLKESWGKETEESKRNWSHISGSLNTLMYLDYIKYDDIHEVLKVLNFVGDKMKVLKNHVDNGMDETFERINFLKIRSEVEKEVRSILNK